MSKNMIKQTIVPQYLFLILIIPVLFGGYLPFISDFKVPVFVTVLLSVVYMIKSYDFDCKSELRVTRIISFCFLTGFIKFLLLDYYSFNVNAADFSFFDHLIPNSINGKFMYTAADESIKMANHPYFIIWLLAPFQILLNSPLVFLIGHGVVLWSAWIPLYLLIKEYNSSAIVRILFLLSFFTFPFVNRVLIFHFHPEVFYIPLFLWSYYFIIKDKKGLFFFISFLICSIKTDAPLYLFLFCLGLFMSKEMDKKTLLKIFVICTCFIALKLFFFTSYEISQKGLSPSDPIEKIKLVAINFYQVNLTQALKNISTTLTDGPWPILFPFLGIPLFIPQVAFVLWPIFLLYSIIDYAPIRGLYYYYSAPIIPFLFIGLIIFLRKKMKFALAINFLLLGSFFLAQSNDYQREYIKFERPQYSYSTFEVMKSQIDMETGVLCTQGTLFPHFSFHQNLKLLRKDCLLDQHKYYLFNKSQSFFPYKSELEFQKVFKRLDENSDYLKYQLRDFVLYKKISNF